MSLRSPRTIALAVALGAASLLALPAAGAKGLETVHPAHLPLSFGLPSGWQVLPLAPGSRFDAVSADGAAHLDVTAGPFPGTFPEFVATETAASRAHYHSEDAKASVSVHTVALLSGPALEIEVRLTHGAPLAITLFSVLHGGVTYHFTYYTSQSLAAMERPLFSASADSINFR